MQIAIADEDFRVSLWCEYEGMTDDGQIKFWVINGAWDGKYKDGMVDIHYTKDILPGNLVWAGKAPFMNDQYNEAIVWIQEQIDNGWDERNNPYDIIALEKEYRDIKAVEDDEWDDIPF